MERLEEMNIDDIQNELSKYRFTQPQLDYFREQEFDGIVIANLDKIPEFPGRTLGSFIKFKAFVKKMTGKEYDEKEGKFYKREDILNEKNQDINLVKTNLILGSSLNAHQNEVYLSESLKETVNEQVFLDTSFSSEPKAVSLMPVFNSELENQLKKDRINKFVLLQMVTEIVKFYKNENIRLDTKTHYKEISEYIISKYPSVVKALEREKLSTNIEEFASKNDSYLVSILSQKISKKNRNIRYLNKISTINTNSETYGDTSCEHEQYTLVDDTEDVVEIKPDCETLLKQMKQNSQNKKIKISLTQFLTDTFDKRRERLENTSLDLDQKLKKFKYIVTEENLIHEFGLIIGTTSFEKKLEQLFDVFEGELIFKDFTEKSNEALLSILLEVEMKLNSKCKKNEWKPICLVYDINDQIEIDKNFVCSPRIFVIKNGLLIDKYLIVNLQNVLMELPKEKSFFRVLSLLLSFYFVFNIEYDHRVENILLFFDEILIQSKREGITKKTETYLKYLKIVKDKFNNI
ncbi:unnamed protein product [Brachionus calyciflorus]|uniref:Uncharacterized protein n=1 Tax=Brachionus calyciflorus TaxID=104777 RepID=A0A814G9S0_9BILA|nr:unnamed protein product [Brachionus calyciflorus]